MIPLLALTVWLAWLGLLGLLAAQLAGGAWHPHFLPATAGLATLVGTGAALIVAGGRRVVRGPGRARALAWLLIGAAPLGFFAGHGLYGVEVRRGRQVDLTWALRLLAPLAESLMDLEARIRYPQRTAGAKVVMISTPVADAAAQVAAMDRHIGRLESRLGRSMRGRSHWVRGPLLGMDGRAIFGLCLGSRPGTAPTGDDGLAVLDRHEVAHTVITSFYSLGSDPPALLVEGWAEAHCGLDPDRIAGDAWEYREGGQALSLRELTGPEWFGRHERPVYVQGAALVNHLLDTYGPRRFLDLYLNSRPATFGRDCRRILGVDLDRLDADYWADVDRRVARDGPPDRSRLRRLGLGPSVKAEEWRAFLDDYLAATGRLLAPYRDVRMTIEKTYSGTDERGKSSSRTTRFVYRNSGDRLLLRVVAPEVENVYLATPGRSLRARRETGAVTWEVGGPSKATGDRAYRRLLDTIGDIGHFPQVVAPLLSLSRSLGMYVEAPRVVVSHLDRIDDGGRRLVRVRLENREREHPLPWRSLTLVLDPDDVYAVRSTEQEDSEGLLSRTEFQYDRVDGIPVLRSIRNSGSRLDAGPPRLATPFVFEDAVTDRHFGPSPASEFEPGRVLDGPQVRIPENGRASVWFAGWYRVLLILGAVSLVAGMALLLRDRQTLRRSPGLAPRPG